MNRDMKAAAVTTVLLAAGVLHAAAAAAQSHFEAVPSVTVGSIYDDNLFATGLRGDAGEMFTVRPGFGSALDTPRLNVTSLFTFDSQRSNHADLSMIDARRHADAKMLYRSTPETTLGMNAQYDRTDVPGEINLGTGILGPRQQAYRWEVAPNISHRIRRHTSATASYDMMAESLVENGSGRMQVVRAGLTQEYSERTNFMANVQERHFADPSDATNGSDSFALLAGWDHQISPLSRFSLQAGPRISTYRGLQPEILAGYTRTTNRLVVGADYNHTETIVLGIRGPVVLNGGDANFTWPWRRTIEIASHSALSRIDTLDTHRITSYRETVIGSWSPGGMYTFNASYAIDYQQGAILNSVFSSGDVLRHVFGVSVTVAPRYSRYIKSPDDPAARAKGVAQ
jgi:hypothetical protein